MNNNPQANQTHSLLLTYSFDNDIEKVYLGLFGKECLEKLGLSRQEISPTGNKLVKYLNIDSLQLDIMQLHSVSTPTSKIIEETMLIFELFSNERKDPFMNEYLERVPFSKTNEILRKIKDYLHYITNSILSIESITVNRPLKQVFTYILNFNKVICANKNKKECGNYLFIDKLYIDTNKASISIKRIEKNNKSEIIFSLIKLSSVSSFVVIENVFGFVLREKYLSNYNQSYLRTLKQLVEKEVCCS